MTELNQKLTKLSHKTFNTGQGRLNGEKKKKKNYLCKNWGVKEGGGRLLEGGVFSGAMVHSCTDELTYAKLLTYLC